MTKHNWLAEIAENIDDYRRKDPVGSKKDANTIWQYYLNTQRENDNKNEPSLDDGALVFLTDTSNL